MLIFFDALGVSSGSTKLSKKRTLNELIRLLYISIISFLTVFKFCFMFGFFSSHQVTDLINEVIQFSAPLYTCWLIILESLIQQRFHKQFWETIANIYRCNCTRAQYDCRRFILKLVEFFAVTITAVFVGYGMSAAAHYIIVIAYTILIKIFHLRIFYYLFCLDVVNFELNMIKLNIETIENDADTTNETLNERSKAEFKWFRKYFHSAYEMVTNLNQTFGWSHLSAIPCCFYLLSTDFNWIYAHGQTVFGSHFISKYQSISMML